MTRKTRDETLTDWIQAAVDRGATSIEEIHKAIADLPLDVMERNGLFEQTAAEVRKLQDQSIGAVYDVIRDVNRRIGELASDLLYPRGADSE
jgi:hypothetical protein